MSMSLINPIALGHQDDHGVLIRNFPDFPCLGENYGALLRSVSR